MILEQADYSFNAATKEVTFNAPYNTIELQQIELIVNVVDNIIIYQFNKNTKGGTLVGAVLTLTYDTTAMSNGDILMVIVSVASTSSGLTDAELRATPVPVSGTVAVTGAGDASASNQTSGSQKTQIVDGAGDVADIVPLNTQIVNTDKGVVVNAVIHGTPDAGVTFYDALVKSDGSLKTYSETSAPAGTNYIGKVRLTDGVTDADVVPLAGYNAQAVAIVDIAGNQITVGDATAANQTALNTLTGAVTETAPISDTASSGLNGRLQRIAQRITSLITALGSPFQAGGSIGNTAFGVNNAAGASAVNIQDGGNSVTVDSSQLPAALVTGRLDVNVGARAVSTPTKTGGNSIITLQSVAASSVLVSSAVDVSTKWKASLNVFFGRRSATAAGAGVNIYIEGSTFASGDDNWATLAQYTTGFAAAEAEAVTGTVSAGATVITCASTTNLTAQDYIYIDNGTIANSEWRRIKSIVAATSVTVIDALTNAQTSSTMYDSAETYNADLDLSSIMRIRVVADGSLFTQAFAIKVTSTYLDSIV